MGRVHDEMVRREIRANRLTPTRRKRRFKGGFRNNGQPRVTLPRGLTRVAQLKAAIRDIQNHLYDKTHMSLVAIAALEGTYIPPHLRRAT